MKSLEIVVIIIDSKSPVKELSLDCEWWLFLSLKISLNGVVEIKILVTGGAGYVGSHVVHQLIDEGFEVVVIDNLNTGNAGAVHDCANFYKGDLRDIGFVRSVFKKEKIGCVVHSASSSVVGESMTTPLGYYDNNVLGSMVLLRVMIEHGVNKIIFSSTASVYGHSSGVPITEEHKVSPTNVYGETKRVVENFLKWCDTAYGVKHVTFRYFNVGGAREDGKIGEDHHPETHLIPIVLNVAVGNNPHVTVFGDDYDTLDGTSIRDYVHVEDVANAHILALGYLDRKEKSGVFNLGSNRGFSVKEIIRTAQEVTGREIPYKIDNRRAGDAGMLIASNKKASRVLGWDPLRTSLEKIIQDAWNWHSNNPYGYRG